MSIKKIKTGSEIIQINPDIIVDNRISSGAFRLYCYIKSLPDDWEVNNNDLRKKLKISSNNTIAKYFRQLIETGWLNRERAKDEDNNLLGGFDYEVY